MENNVTQLPAHKPNPSGSTKNVYDFMPEARELSFAELLDLEHEFRKLRINCVSKTWKQGQICRVIWPKDGRKYTGVVMAGGTKLHLWFPCDDTIWPVDYSAVCEMTDRIAAVETHNDGFRVEQGWKIKLRDEFKDE